MLSGLSPGGTEGRGRDGPDGAIHPGGRATTAWMACIHGWSGWATNRFYRLVVGGRVDLSRLLAGGLGFDEGGDPVVQFVDPVEAAVAARDDGHLRTRHEAPTGAGLRRSEQGTARAGDQQDWHADRAEFVVGEDGGELRLRPVPADARPHERHPA